MEDCDYYIECDGRIVANGDNFVGGKNYYVRLRVLGGKGGMLLYHIPIYVYFFS